MSKSQDRIVSVATLIEDYARFTTVDWLKVHLGTIDTKTDELLELADEIERHDQYAANFIRSKVDVIWDAALSLWHESRDEIYRLDPHYTSQTDGNTFVPVEENLSISKPPLSEASESDEW